MPGYYVHLAACHPEARKNRSFVLGVEAPDLLKKYYLSYGLEGTRDRYNSLKTPDMPDFSWFVPKIEEEENKDGSNGLHFGWSSNPDVRCFWNILTPEEKKNYFFIGYLCHLLPDLLVYKCLDFEKKFEEIKRKNPNGENMDFILQEIQRLRGDWDKINSRIRDEYPDVILTPEVLELGEVKYSDSDQFNYIDYYTVKTVIDYFRHFNPIHDNIDDMIEKIYSDLPRLCEDTRQHVLKKKEGEV